MAVSHELATTLKAKFFRGLAGSVALQADSLDMLGDTLVYGFSLFALARSDRWKTSAALLKGGIMALTAVVVLAQAA